VLRVIFTVTLMRSLQVTHPVASDRSAIPALVSASVVLRPPMSRLLRRVVMTFCTISSRADTARTRRRCIRLCARSASLLERAGRLARDTVDPAMDVERLRPGEGGANCAESPPQRQARCASRSVRPLHWVNHWVAIVYRGKRVRFGGAGRIGSKRLDPGAPTTPQPALPAG
jgi:hypothetical protein